MPHTLNHLCLYFFSIAPKHITTKMEASNNAHILVHRFSGSKVWPKEGSACSCILGLIQSISRCRHDFGEEPVSSLTQVSFSDWRTGVPVSLLMVHQGPPSAPWSLSTFLHVGSYISEPSVNPYSLVEPLTFPSAVSVCLQSRKIMHLKLLWLDWM